METYDIELIDSSTGDTIVWLYEQTSMSYFKGLQVTLKLRDETKSGYGFDNPGKLSYTVESVILEQEVTCTDSYEKEYRKYFVVTLKQYKL